MNISPDNTFEAIADSMNPVSIAEAEKVAMLRRTDTKFIAEEKQLVRLLSVWKEDFDILEINGIKHLKYRTVYLDTPDFKCYTDHHNGKANRYKIRFRDYLDSELTFFEIKRKIFGRETLKSRKKLSFHKRCLDDELKAMLRKEGIHHPQLEEKIVNTFSRISLIAKNKTERITIDTNLVFSNGHQTIAIPELVIIELKQEKADFNTIAMKHLKKQGIRPVNFSKYVAAVSLLEKTVKYNNLKPLHLKLQQLADAYEDND
jgi:hypothetical protein